MLDPAAPERLPSPGEPGIIRSRAWAPREEEAVLRSLVLLILILAAACAPADHPPRERLERLYTGLVLAAAPGADTTGASPSSMRALVDSFGGPARVESLLAESMTAEPERWRTFLDSLAKNLP